jgi:DNA polymerase I-like protein with 3'-5' exonuclease and polymerase domains
MADEPKGLTWNIGMQYDPEGRKAGGGKLKRDVDNELFGTGLFDESLAPTKAGALVEKFMIPPFTVLNAREGWWQDRKRAWLDLGIKSELGRGEDGTNPAVNITDAAGIAAPGGSAMPAIQAPATAAPLTETAPNPAPAAPPARKINVTAPTGAKKAEAPPAASLGVRRVVMQTDAVAPKASRRFAEAAGIPRSLIMPKTTWVAPTELPSLSGVKRLSFDVETKDPDLSTLGPGARRPDCHIIGMSLGTDDGRRWYFPVRHAGGGNLDPDVVFRWARTELNAFDGALVGANLLYDLDFAANEGITFNRVKTYHDVMVLEPLIDEWRLSYSLDALSTDYLGIGKDETLLREAAAAHGWHTEKEIKRNLWQLPAGYVGAYAEADADRPLMILDKQLAKINEEDLGDVYDVERRLIPLLLAMRRRGVRINPDRADEAKTALTRERDKWLAEVRRMSTPRAELMQPETFVDALRDCGLEIPMTPKTQQPSITKPFLERHRKLPLVSAILAGRKLNTVINTFIDGHILGHAINGRIHCEFKQLKGGDDGDNMGGTIARFSSANPNLQNIPAREDDELTSLTGINIPKVIRAIFEPEPGERWEKLDESQVEYRLLAHFAVGQGADECRVAYTNDPRTDYHKLVSTFLGIDPEDKSRRKKVKGINFAKGYGAGAPKLAQLIGCTLEEATEFVQLYETRLAFAGETYNACMRWGGKVGHVITVLKRRQRFPLWEPANNYGSNKRPALLRDAALAAYGPRIVRADTYKAMNRKLQGSAADIMKKAMADAWDAGCYAPLGGAPLLTVHDEQDISNPATAVAEEAMAEVKYHMEHCIALRVPLICDRESGNNWGEAS